MKQSTLIKEQKKIYKVLEDCPGFGQPTNHQYNLLK